MRRNPVARGNGTTLGFMFNIGRTAKSYQSFVQLSVDSGFIKLLFVACGTATVASGVNGNQLGYQATVGVARRRVSSSSSVPAPVIHSASPSSKDSASRRESSSSGQMRKRISSCIPAELKQYLRTLNAFYATLGRPRAAGQDSAQASKPRAGDASRDNWMSRATVDELTAPPVRKCCNRCDSSSLSSVSVSSASSSAIGSVAELVTLSSVGTLLTWLCCCSGSAEATGSVSDRFSEAGGGLLDSPAFSRAPTRDNYVHVTRPHLAGGLHGAGYVNAGRGANKEALLVQQAKRVLNRHCVGYVQRVIHRCARQVLRHPALPDALSDGAVALAFSTRH
uniref:Uncharacterized protein n=1 Tax=Macrostomum lignano TaxID=282301 RepID=A0A1I8FTJ1_9PLAT